MDEIQTGQKFVITAPGIDLRSVKPGSVLMVRYGEHLAPYARAKVAMQIKSMLSEAGMARDVVIFMAKPGDDLEVIDEPTMNKAGWFRKIDQQLGDMRDISSPKIVEVRTDKDLKTLWVNVDEKCVLRCCHIKEYHLIKHSGGPH
jgi:hypothetical protein